MKKILIVLSLTLGLAACDNRGAATSSSPANSAETLIRLLDKGEVQAAKKFLNKDSQRLRFPEIMAQNFAQDRLKEVQIENEKIHGDVANVGLSYETNSGHKEKLYFSMVLEDRNWVASSYPSNAY